MPAEYAMLLTMHYQVFDQVELFSDQVISIQPPPSSLQPPRAQEDTPSFLNSFLLREPL